MAGVVDPLVGELGLLLSAVAPLVAAGPATLAEQLPVDDDLARWARSGAMALTGDADGPPLAPGPPVASRLAAAGLLLAELTERLGRRVEVDAPALLGERAALRGLARRGAISAGGGCRMLATADGWLAVSLVRADDWTLATAWLRREVVDQDWDAIAAAVAGHATHELVRRAAELGLAVGAPPVAATGTTARSRTVTAPWRVTSPAAHRTRRAPLRVVDLSALWAGPLCAHLLGLAGADVVTVEDPARRDGARRGDADLHALLHAGHAQAEVHFSTAAGRRQLRDLLADADVVVTAARHRALVTLGIDPPEMVANRPGLTWVAVTGHGLASNRIGFGDDAGVAGGLAACCPETGDAPRFCADAVADPATGLYAAVAAAATVLRGGGLVDIALRDVAAHLAREPHETWSPVATYDGGQWVVDSTDRRVAVAPPRARLLSPA